MSDSTREPVSAPAGAAMPGSLNDAINGSARESARPPLLEPVRAAYVHIPFCVRKCAYCDFTSYAGCLDQLPAYVDALLREIGATAAGLAPGLKAPLDSVFFGGGTPSLLPPSDIDRILNALSRSFGLAVGAEITFEANPGTLTAARLAACRTAGCNRISIGVQTLAPHLLQLLGRIHRPEEAVEALLQAEAAGFEQISADLMFGLPGQTLNDVAATAQRVLALPVTHLSFYSLSLEPGTPFYSRYHDHPELLPDDETERAQYACLIAAGAAAGLRHYEISNAARPGAECRHNLVYWRAEPYFGFGAGAHRYVGGVRRANCDSISAYMEQIKAATAGAPDISGVNGSNRSGAGSQQSGAGSGASDISGAGGPGEFLTRADQEQEFMLLGLRLLDGVDGADFQRRFGGDLFARFQPEIAPLLAQGLLEQCGSRLRLTRTGLDFANQVFMAFV